MILSSARNSTPGFAELTNALFDASWLAPRRDGIEGEIQRAVANLVLERLMMLAVSENADAQVRTIALDAVNSLDDWLGSRIASENNGNWRAHYGFARFRIGRMRDDPASLGEIKPVTTPPGEPIGTSPDWY
jgi:hypothetical protein